MLGAASPLWEEMMATGFQNHRFQENLLHPETLYLK
jgi:hypothetical protein